MLLYAKTLYLSFIFNLYSNKRVTVNYGNIIKPTTNTYYTGPDISGYNVKISDGKDEDKTMGIVFVEKEKIDDINTSQLYVFCNQDGINSPMITHQSILFDPKILKIVIDLEIFLFLKRIINENKEKITISVKDNGGGYPWNIFNFILFIVLTVFLYKFCRGIVKKLSKMDPIFTNFNIMSSNLIKFKEIEDKSMPECSICFEEFTGEDDVRLLDCKHYFHPACIDRWLIKHTNKCPCCRNDVVINEKV